MNKKRELVNTVLENMEKANVVLPSGSGADLDVEYTFRSRDSDRYWKRYPEGHCRQDDCCIEQQLACLDEHSLEDILAVGDIPQSIKWDDLWRMWGTLGCFQCVPTILDDGEHIPTLRIRHDSYLSWFRGYAFQNSYDAHANGSNGSSGTDLQLAENCVSCPYYETDEERVKWEQDNTLFRKALILSYPMAAAGHQHYFHRMLQKYPEIFEEFINKTDACKMHLNLDTSMTLEQMHKQAHDTAFDGPIIEELALVREDGACMILRYNENCVGVSWSEHGENQSMVISIPEWNKDLYMEELSDIGDMNCGEYPDYPDMRNYLYCCWTGLTTTLLTLAGVQASAYFWRPTKRLGIAMDRASAGLFAQDKQATGLQAVWDKLYALSRTYPGFKELSKEYLNG